MATDVPEPPRKLPVRLRIQQAAMRYSLQAMRAGETLPRIIGEIPYVLYSPGFERAVNEAYYNANILDYSEARHQRAGLFPFEAEMLSRYFPKPPARLLLPGAGTGRELLVLLDLGYEVQAFEPVQAMVTFANSTLAGRARVRQMTLQGFLASSGGEYDGIFTGWGMWTHMTSHDDRIAALRALLGICNGPLLLSFVRRDSINYAFDGHRRGVGELHPAGDGIVQRFMRTILRRRLLRRAPIERGLALHEGMFKHIYTEEEIEDEARETGWRVEFYNRDATQYGHALLLPA